MDVYVKIGDAPLLKCDKNSACMVVKEDEDVLFKIITNDTTLLPELYIEDYSVDISLDSLSIDGSAIYTTCSSKYFKECFGLSNVRIFSGEEYCSLLFDSYIKEEHAGMIKDMVSYISEKGFDILQSVFSRSYNNVDMRPSNSISPEALITSSENIINYLHGSKGGVFKSLKSRLISCYMPSWKISNFSIDVMPYDVVSNIDQLYPSPLGEGDVIIRKRHFKISCPDSPCLKESYDILENQIILGCLYSVRKKITSLLGHLNGLETGNISSVYGYESFERVLLSLTAKGMISRCSKVILSCDDFIKTMTNKYGIKFSGEILPKITPFIRGSKVYRAIYDLVFHWYKLGEPILDGVYFIMKLRSISKLYEIFSMIKFFDYFVSSGWTISGVVPHSELKIIPQKVTFSLDDEELFLSYEPYIKPYNESITENGNLVDTNHRPNAIKYAYWNPDFVIKHVCKGLKKYYIFDSKYSSKYTVKSRSLPELYRKYYEGMGVYDELNGVITNGNILSVMAIYALPGKGKNYIAYWPNGDIFSKIPRVPMIGGIELSSYNSDVFKEALDKIFKIGSRMNV